MPQEPLTPQGVATKTATLYALSDPDLKAQATLVKNSFIQWIKDNFALTADQLNYLPLLNPDWTAYSANEASVAILHRLPIVLETSAFPPHYPPSSKYVHTDSGILVSFNTTGGVTYDGSLKFRLVYQG